MKTSDLPCMQPTDSEIRSKFTELIIGHDVTHSLIHSFTFSFTYAGTLFSIQKVSWLYILCTSETYPSLLSQCSVASFWLLWVLDFISHFLKTCCDEEATISWNNDACYVIQSVGQLHVRVACETWLTWGKCSSRSNVLKGMLVSVGLPFYIFQYFTQQVLSGVQ